MATAWILLVCLGTWRLTVSLSSSFKIEGIAGEKGEGRAAVVVGDSVRPSAWR